MIEIEVSEHELIEIHQHWQRGYFMENPPFALQRGNRVVFANKESKVLHVRAVITWVSSHQFQPGVLVFSFRTEQDTTKREINEMTGHLTEHEQTCVSDYVKCIRENRSQATIKMRKAYDHAREELAKLWPSHPAMRITNVSD